MTVRMQYPALPDGQDIEVAELSVPTYERMGWKVVDQPSTDETTAAATSRRRTTKETS